MLLKLSSRSGSFSREPRKRAPPPPTKTAATRKTTRLIITDSKRGGSLEGFRLGLGSHYNIMFFPPNIYSDHIYYLNATFYSTLTVYPGRAEKPDAVYRARLIGGPQVW